MSHFARTFPREPVSYARSSNSLTPVHISRRNYASSSFWNKRYTDRKASEELDWYCGYDDLQAIITAFVPKDAYMLVPGCGDAPFSVDAFNDGYRHQLGVDNSKAVIDMMAARTAGMDGLAWSCEDLCDMKSIDGGKFGAVVDKATFDCIFCDKDRTKVQKMLAEVHRVLQDGGVFILVSGACQWNAL